MGHRLRPLTGQEPLEAHAEMNFPALKPGSSEKHEHYKIGKHSDWLNS